MFVDIAAFDTLAQSGARDPSLVALTVLLETVALSASTPLAVRNL